MLIDQNNIRSIMDHMAEIEVKSRDTYKSEGKSVPRVTEVLSAMLHEDYLMSWANGLGWKRISYRGYMREAADKGTYSHLAVERYLKNGHLDLDELNIPNEKIKDVVRSCMDGFMKWWINIHNEYKDIEIIFLEESMIHPYFGGTCDCLLRVDGKYYLIDFKTSNHMSYNYGLQLAAYRFLLKELKGIDVSMCSILMLSKTDHDYKVYTLNLEDKSHKDFIDNCEQTFLTLLAGYKMRLYTNEQYYETFGIEKYKKK